MTRENAIKAYLPMTETMYYILLALAEPRHGYGVKIYVREITSGRIDLAAGTIYNSLFKLERDGLVSILAQDGKRKIYVVSEIGLDILRAEITRLNELCENGSLLQLFA